MIRVISIDELKYDNIINKKLFPEVIYLDSDNFYDDRHTKDATWYGYFDDETEKLVTAAKISYKNDHIDLALIETIPRKRGKGYGTKLINFLIKEYSRNKKYKYMELDCMYDDLEKYYNRFGFTFIEKKALKTMRRPL